MTTARPSPGTQFKIGAIVLAAGFSERFGAVKLCAPMADGRTVLQHTLAQLAPAVDEIIIVTRDEVAALLPTEYARPLICPQAKEGMGASLAFAIRQQSGWDACLVCLADMPLIATDSYRRLREHLTPDNIVLPRYQGRNGNPAGFGQKYFPELARLQGDRGGRVVLENHPDAIQTLALNDPAILLDIDTPEDLQRLGKQKPL